jgi:hypothetical protein
METHSALLRSLLYCSLSLASFADTAPQLSFVADKDMAKAMASGVGYNAHALHHNFERMHLF